MKRSPEVAEFAKAMAWIFPMFPIEHAKAIGIVAYRRTSRNNHAACGTADAVPAARKSLAGGEPIAVST
jgi:hypothetical protein